MALWMYHIRFAKTFPSGAIMQGGIELEFTTDRQLTNGDKNSVLRPLWEVAKEEKIE